MPQQTRNTLPISRWILAWPCLIALLTACGGIPEQEGTPEDVPLATVSTDRAALGSCAGNYQVTHECRSSCEIYTGTSIRCWDGKPVWQCKATSYDVHKDIQDNLSYAWKSDSLNWKYWCSTTAPNSCPAFCQ